MDELCRLCSKNDKLVNMYNPRLKYARHLRRFIYLATNVQIDENDPVSKMVCYKCCKFAMKSHKIRIKAIANDKRLKEQCGQPATPPSEQTQPE